MLILWLPLCLAGLGVLAAVSSCGQPEVVTPPHFTTLAILPFEAREGGAEERLLASGLSYDLYRRLQSLSTIQGVSRRRVVTAAHGTESRAQLARRTGGEMLVAGEVRRQSGRVEVAVEVEDARSGRVIAQLQLNSDAEQIFDLQRRLALQIVEILDLPATSRERRQLQSHPSRSLKAWSYYVQGLSHLEDLTDPRGARFAADLFQHALRLDPTFTHADLGLAEAAWWSYLRGAEGADLLSTELAVRAILAREPASVAATVLLCKIVLTRESSGDRPRRVPAEIWRLDKPDEALREVASGLWQAGRLEAAEAALLDATRTGDGFWLNSYALGLFRQQGGRLGEAITAFQTALSESPPETPWAWEALFEVQLATGDFVGAARTFETWSGAATAFHNLRRMALAYAALGELDKAEGLYRRSLNLRPTEVSLHRELGDLLLRTERQAEAAALYATGLALLEEQRSQAGPDDASDLILALLTARTGDCYRALSLASTLGRNGEQTAGSLHDLALVFVLCQQTETALETLQAAVARGLAPEVLLSRPEFERLAHEPAFQALVQDAAGLPPSP